MRLDAYVQKSLSLSRREAKKLIRSGSVLVDGTTHKSGSDMVDGGAHVTCEGEKLTPAGKVYLMMHKPNGVVCSLKDDEHTTVIDLLPPEYAGIKGLHPAGRLDRDTTGLLLLSNDGDWTHRLISPRVSVEKQYQVTLKHPASETDFASLEEGVLLRGEKKKTKPAGIEITGEKKVNITISEGKYHQVKRMTAFCGNRVAGLHRSALGTLVLDPVLEPGEVRELSAKEKDMPFLQGNKGGRG